MTRARGGEGDLTWACSCKVQPVKGGKDSEGCGVRRDAIQRGIPGGSGRRTSLPSVGDDGTWRPVDADVRRALVQCAWSELRTQAQLALKPQPAIAIAFQTSVFLFIKWV